MGAGPAAVLVHGLYHRPEHFAPVADGLRAEVVVPELHRGSLAADTAAVQAAVDALQEPPLLLGHSYGGSVITGVRGARHLVYVAAFVPDVGESAATLGGASPRLRAAIEPATGGPEGTTLLHPGRAAEVLYGDCPEPLAARAVGLLRAQAPGCGRGVPEHHSWKRTPSTYVVCAGDRAIDPALQRTMAARCTGVLEWRTGHSPFVSRPALVVELVKELLAGVSPRP
ncbi:alpha/beta hydrolase [Streptomyces microflavus]|uniref:alpha/beta hydrolase n=1 Tax=Streptomyces microflavus TaxID=1919 RepID=UPI003402B6E3